MHTPAPSGHALREPKIKEPEMFSGHDPSKLYGFLAHCKMACRSQPSRFTLESARIIWAGSYLTDTARQWFQRLIMESEESPVLSNWSLFEEELHTYFGDPDEVATQERKLHMLKMSEHNRVLCYINQFKEGASLTRWNDDALRSQFYQGLPNHLQDDISREGKPVKLQGMYQAALKFDGRYWERQEELKAMRSSDRGTHSSSSRAMNSASSSTPSSSTTHKPKIHKTSGELKEEEKERRKRENLCAYCGNSGHSVDNCTKRRGSSRNTATTAATSTSSTTATPSTTSRTPVARATFTFSGGPDTPQEPRITEISSSPSSDGSAHLRATISSLSPSSFITMVSIPLLSHYPVS